MGRILIIKGADFSSCAVEKLDIDVDIDDIGGGGGGVSGGDLTDVAIQFEDEKTLQALLAFGIGSDGKITYGQAAAVTTLPNFNNDTHGIELFDELQYFTGITTLGYNFHGYGSLKKINLKNIVSLEGYTFYGNTNLSNIGDTSKLKTIYNLAFMATALQGPIDLRNVESIGSDAFKQIELHSNNFSFLLPDTPPTLINAGGLRKTDKLYVSSEAVKTAYENNSQWSVFSSAFIVGTPT